MKKYEDLKQKRAYKDSLGGFYVIYGEFNEDKPYLTDILTINFKRRNKGIHFVKNKINEFINKHNTLDIKLGYNVKFDAVYAVYNVK